MNHMFLYIYYLLLPPDQKICLPPLKTLFAPFMYRDGAQQLFPGVCGYKTGGKSVLILFSDLSEENGREKG
jgi:hypothetical protein